MIRRPRYGILHTESPKGLDLCITIRYIRILCTWRIVYRELGSQRNRVTDSRCSSRLLLPNGLKSGSKNIWTRWNVWYACVTN